MERLVDSSRPGEVEWDAAVRLLAERAALTRAVCRELQEAKSFLARRPKTALSLLLAWIASHFPDCVRFEPQPADGLEQMTVPEGCHEFISRGLVVTPSET